MCARFYHYDSLHQNHIVAVFCEFGRSFRLNYESLIVRTMNLLTYEKDITEEWYALKNWPGKYNTDDMIYTQVAERMAEEIKTLRDEMKEADDQNRNIKKNFDVLRQSHENMRGEISDLKGEILSLENQRDHWEEIAKRRVGAVAWLDLKEKLSRAETSLEHWRDEVGKLSLRVNTLKHKLENAQEETQLYYDLYRKAHNSNIALKYTLEKRVPKVKTVRFTTNADEDSRKRFKVGKNYKVTQEGSAYYFVESEKGGCKVYKGKSFWGQYVVEEISPVVLAS